jgi:cation transport ATPase
MARKKLKEDKKERNKKESPETESESYLQEETVRAIVAVAFFVIAVFLLMSAFGKGGLVGAKSFELFSFLFGIGYYLMPTIFFILCVSFFRTLHKRLALTHSIGGVLFFVASLSLVNISMPVKVVMSSMLPIPENTTALVGNLTVVSVAYHFFCPIDVRAMPMNANVMSKNFFIIRVCLWPRPFRAG